MCAPTRSSTTIGSRKRSSIGKYCAPAVGTGISFRHFVEQVMATLLSESDAASKLHVFLQWLQVFSLKQSPLYHGTCAHISFPNNSLIQT
jgi:hypothetical protein